MSRVALLLLFLPGCWVTGTERGEREQWWYQISGGYQSTCGVVGTGGVECWGEIAESAPDRQFTSVSAGYQHACGITEDEVLCWGSVGAEGAAILTEPSGPEFTDVSTLAFDACAINTEKELRCWGTTTSIGSDVPIGDFLEVTVGEYFACALGEDGDLACWGQQEYGETSPPAGLFHDLDVADDHACAISDEDAMVCWGEAQFAALDDD
jgi:alpha-tubulin suppressor-like RCC1 family protein